MWVKLGFFFKGLTKTLVRRFRYELVFPNWVNWLQISLHVPTTHKDYKLYMVEGKGIKSWGCEVKVVRGSRIYHLKICQFGILIIMSCIHLNKHTNSQCRQSVPLNWDYLPKDRSFKRNSIVIAPFQTIVSTRKRFTHRRRGHKKWRPHFITNNNTS